MSLDLIKSILIVEDNPGDARLLREMFKEVSQETHLSVVESMSEAVKHLAIHTADIILLDLGLPDAQGVEAIRQARAAADERVRVLHRQGRAPPAVVDRSRYRHPDAALFRRRQVERSDGGQAGRLISSLASAPGSQSRRARKPRRCRSYRR